MLTCVAVQQENTFLDKLVEFLKHLEICCIIYVYVFAFEQMKEPIALSCSGIALSGPQHPGSVGVAPLLGSCS